MIERDYIMREIEKIPIVIAKLINSKANPLKDKQIGQEVHNGLNLFNVSLCEIKNNPPEKIFETLQNKNNLSLLINLVEAITLWDTDVSLVKFFQYVKTQINTHQTKHSIFYLQDSRWRERSRYPIANPADQPCFE